MVWSWPCQDREVEPVSGGGDGMTKGQLQEQLAEELKEGHM